MPPCSSRRCPARPALPALVLALWLSPAALLANPLERDAEILIQSDPPGAAVMALGKTWGVTPMRLKVREAFPALYRPEQPYIGMAVHLSKAGCAEYREPIHRRSIPAEIHAELDCEPAVRDAATAAAREPASQPTPAPAAGTAPATPARPATVTGGNVATKLRELEQLRKDGLVSEQEYQQLRKKVLDYF